MPEEKNRLQRDADRLSPQHLLQLDPREAEDLFNRLAREQQIQLVLAAHWQQRRDIIMLAEDARGLVQALPPQEIHMTVLQNGVEDSLQLIALTSHEQLQFLFDMQCWKKDSLNPADIARWYALLAKCNEQKVLDWFEKADDEFLVASLKKVLKVVKIQQDTDISEEYQLMPAATLDGIYFFIFLEKDAYGYIMPLMNALYQNDRDRFYSLAEGILWDSPPEVEEGAYAWKTRRLAEYGFPEFEEAVSIYQIMPDSELERLTASIQHDTFAQERAGAVLPRYILSGVDMPRFFMDALGRIEDADTSERIQRAVIALANKIIVADALDVQSFDDTQRAFLKAAGSVSLALESLSTGNIATAQIYLEQVHPATLFRAGISIIMKVRKEYLGTAWHISDRQLLESFLGPPLSETLHGLSMQRPMIYGGLLNPKQLQYRAFMSLQDVQAAREALLLCSAVDNLLFVRWNIDPDWMMSGFIAATTLAEPGQLRAEAVFLTVFARYMLSGATRLVALSGAEMRLFIDAVFEQGAEGRYCLRKPLRNDMFAWLATFYDNSIPPALASFIRSVLDSFEETFSFLAGQKTIEQRYVDKLLFKEGQ
jgi:hypothetical protein